MTLEEAVAEMKKGNRVRHRYFDSTEWITINSRGRIETEEGYSVSLAEFWMHRGGASWEIDWELVNNEPEAQVSDKTKDASQQEFSIDFSFYCHAYEINDMGVKDISFRCFEQCTDCKEGTLHHFGMDVKQ